MKKIITLFVAIAAFASAKAQTTKDEARRVILGQPKQTTTSQQGRTVILGRTPQQTGGVYRTNRNVYYKKKSNPGKHLGWYKGTGNPHRYGVKPGKGNKGGRGKHD